MIKLAKKTYFSSAIKEAQGDSRKMWQYINELNKKVPNMLSLNKETIIEVQAIADAFGHQFANVAQKIINDANWTENCDFIYLAMNWSLTLVKDFHRDLNSIYQ